MFTGSGTLSVGLYIKFPSSAVPLAAILEGKVNIQNKKVGIILSGGNLDLGRLPF